MIRLFLVAALLVTTFSSGCALNEIARKEDIVVAKTDLADEILKIRDENRMLSERLETTTRRMEELTGQLQTAKIQTAHSAKFVQERLGQLNQAIAQARTDQEKISTDFSNKIQVVLEEVSKENALLREKIEKLAAQKKSANVGHSQTAVLGNTYTVAPGDTLAKIAKRLGVSVSTLLDLNRIENPNNLKAGQRLTLPAETTAKTN